MDISPVYELRERLKAGAIAGTGLLAEDFRLKRAIDGMAPLEKASPVFARITQLARQSVEEACEDRAGALLDALTLTDALLRTQGAVGVEGEIRPLSKERRKMEETDALMAEVPYSVLSALLDALCHSGNGRYGYVVELRGEQPALFGDYRVQAAMVDGLGASYAELAESVTGWLIEDGRKSHGGCGILSLLQKGFDGKGKKEMVRRVWVMEAIAGQAANSFYVEQLPQAEKEVRGALIYALRHCQENEGLLLELVRKERGNNRKMACYALAEMGGKGAWDYFRTLAAKKPEEAMEYLEQSERPEAAGLAAEILMRLLSGLKESGKKPEKEEAALLTLCLRSLPGKSGEEICACYRQAASFGNALDGSVEGKQEKLLFVPPNRNFREGVPFSRMIPALLQHGLLVHPAKELADVAQELYASYGEAYFPAAMTACLLTKTGGECLDFLKGFVEKKGLLGKRLMRDRAPFVEQAFSPVRVDERTGEYRAIAVSLHPARQRPENHVRPVTAVIPEMYEVLMDLESRGTDQVLFSWIRTSDREMCGRLAAYFHGRALKTGDNRLYLDPLRRCGAEDCRGLAVAYFRAKGKVASWEILYYLNQLPGSAASREAEARSVLNLLKRGDIKTANNAIPVLETFIKEQFAGKA